MNISMKRIQAIFMKDYKEFSRNYAISIMVFMPFILALFYNKMGINTIDAYFMTINLTLAMVTAFIQSCLIAEEKESNTLRSLMMSPASIADILIGKSSLVFSISAIVLALTVYLLGYKPANVLVLALALAVSIVFYIAVGTICGLFTKTVMEASVATLPVLVIFSFGPMVLGLSEKYPIAGIAEWLPSAQLILLAEGLETAMPAKEVFISFAVMIGWTIAAVAIASILYKKRMTDD
ncbi:ABC transporter permease subunit [Lysinibacillus sp. 3P01SB]|uniref:ABC transporter permease subunit n=1 Tax=Lysinibacillus sp. 3P01SB TaxID=3132284 RepID=UPI0039A53826